MFNIFGWQSILIRAVIALAAVGDLPRLMNVAGNPQGAFPCP
jgi:hypothetical protein